MKKYLHVGIAGLMLATATPVCLAQSSVSRETRNKATELNNSALEEFDRNNHAGALDLLNESIALGVFDDAAYLNRAVVHQAMGKYELALKDLARSSELGLPPGRYARQAGSIMELQGDHAAALKHFNRAVEVDPEEPHSFIYRGKFHYRQKSYAQAIADFTAAINIGGLQSNTFVHRARAFHALKRDADAFADLNDAIQIDRNSSAARLYRIRLYRELKQPEKSLPDYAALIQQEPGNRIYLVGRGGVLVQLLRYDEAIADFTRAEKLGYTAAPALIRLARESLKMDALERIPNGLPAKGEIQLTGKILAVGKDSLQLSATAFTSDAGRTRPLSPPKPKAVAIGKTTRWSNSGSGRVSLATLRRGMTISAIGRDAGALQATRLFVRLNTSPPPALTANAVAIPEFKLRSGESFQAGTAFTGRLEDGRTFLVTAHHLLGEAGGLEEDLARNGSEAQAVQVQLLDFARARRTLEVGKYLAIQPTTAASEDDARSDLAVFSVTADSAAKESLLLSPTLPVAGTPVWIACRAVGIKTGLSELYPATVVSSDDSQLVINPEPALYLRGLSGAPVLNSEGAVVGMVLSSRGSLVICNPAAAITARLQAVPATP